MTRTAIVAAGGAAVLSFGVPLVVQADYTLQVLFRIYLFAAMGLAWNLVGGYAGQLSLGHAAYFGAGAYGLAILSGKAGLSPWLAVLGGVGVAVGCAALIGLVSFRLRGPYFTLSTIACAEILRISAKNLTGVTGGDVGAQVPALFGAPISRNFYLAAVVLLAVSFAATVLVRRARFGYALMAVREDEDTAASVGINAARVKLAALVLSAVLTAVAGALYASMFLYIVPDQVLGHEISNQIAIVAMLGGAGTLIGPIVGSVILETAAEVFKNVFQEAHLLIYGGLLIVVVLFLPGGVVGALSRVGVVSDPDRIPLRPRSEPMLEIDHVSKRFGGVRAVNDVTLSIAEGSITFIVGPNGAGKTTLFNMIAGVVRPDAGRIRFKGKDITGIRPDQTARLGIGRTFQVVKPLGGLTVLENVMLGAFLHTASPTQAAAVAREVLTYLQMDRVTNLTARGLPLAMLKRLEIARALATKPSLILLDEVVAGLATAEALALADLLKKLPERGVAAVGGVEHVMAVVTRIADCVVVLDHGVKIAEGVPKDVVRMPVVVEAYLGSKYAGRER